MTSHLDSVETEEECSYLPAEPLPHDSISRASLLISDFCPFLYHPLPLEGKSRILCNFHLLWRRCCVDWRRFLSITWWMFLSLSYYGKSCYNQSCRSLFSFLLHRYLEVAILCLPFGETVSLFSRPPASFLISTTIQPSILHQDKQLFFLESE